MPQHEIPPEIAKAAPGVIASFVAVMLMPGTPLQRAASFIGGAGTSYYGMDYAAQITGAHNGFAAWLLGMFGMAVAHKVFDGLRSFDLSARLDKILSKWGL